MKKFVVLAALLLSFTAFADDSKHMITFSNSVGTGWSGSAGSAETESDSNIKDVTVTNGDLSINYAYRLSSRFQIGFYISNERDETEVKARSGGKIKTEDSSFSLYGVVAYNFSDDLQNAFYLLGGIGTENYESEATDSTGGSTTKSENDYDVTGFLVQFGKRFDLKGLGIENLTYSPAVSFHYGQVGGDLEDGGVESLTQVTLDLIKFDLLF